MDLLDQVSARKLPYTINSLDLLPFNTFSYVGHQKCFPVHYWLWISVVAFPSVLLWGNPSTWGALQPPQPHTSSPCLLWKFLAETWTSCSLSREASSFSSCVAVSFYIWWLLSHPHAAFFFFMAMTCSLSTHPQLPSWPPIAPALLQFPLSSCLQHAWEVPQPLCVQVANTACKNNSSCCFSVTFCPFQAIS